jgi:hypothetical protein
MSYLTSKTLSAIAVVTILAVSGSEAMARGGGGHGGGGHGGGGAHFGGGGHGGGGGGHHFGGYGGGRHYGGGYGGGYRYGFGGLALGLGAYDNYNYYGYYDGDRDDVVCYYSRRVGHRVCRRS